MRSLVTIRWSIPRLAIDLKYCYCDLPAILYVDPAEYDPAERQAHQCWVDIPGKHRNRKAAWDAIHDSMAAVLH